MSPRDQLARVIEEARRTNDWGVVLKVGLAEEILGELPTREGPLLVIGDLIRVQYSPHARPVVCKIHDASEGHVVLCDPDVVPPGPHPEGGPDIRPISDYGLTS